MKRSVFAAFAACLVLLGLLAVPTSAASPDGAYGLFVGTYGRGVVITTYGHDIDTANVAVGVVGLTTSQEYFLVGRSIGCGGTPSGANRVFRIDATTDDDGSLFLHANVAIDKSVKSFWLGSNDALGAAICTRATGYLGDLQEADDYNGDGALGLVKTGAGTLPAIALVNKRAGGNARLAIALDGLTPGHSYSIKGMSRSCSRTGGVTEFRASLANTGQESAFLKTTVKLGQEALDAVRSIRIRDTTASAPWLCVPMIIMANTEGDFQ